MTQQSDKALAQKTPEEMLEEIERLAVAGDFNGAERLREQLMEVHSLAVSEIVGAAEIIDEQKSIQIDGNHMRMWQDLYNPLSKEERNCLFYSTKTAKISSGKLLFSQGKSNTRLFFIESGTVTLFHTKGGDNSLIGRLGEGDMAGEEAIVDITNPTLSAVCQTEVNVRYLDTAQMPSWEKQCPGLAARLRDFCTEKSLGRRRMQAQEIEKRGQERYALEGRVISTLFDGNGQPTENSFKGFIQDISTGGMSFEIRCSNQQTARALLGRTLGLEIEGKELARPLTCEVVRVGFLLHNEYSVHVRFTEPLLKRELTAII